jgi:hypothetical protein
MADTDYALDVFLETFDGLAPPTPSPCNHPENGGSITPTSGNTTLSSTTIAIGDPIAFKVGTGGQLMRLRLINSHPVAIYLQMVYADSAMTAIASVNILDEFLIPAGTMTHLENLSGSFVYTQEFWARASTTHQSGTILNASSGRFLTGEIIRGSGAFTQGANAPSADILTAILAELKSWVLTRNY